MASPQPHLIVLAGPNGSGKSTTAPALLKGTLGVTEFVNADTIAAGLCAFDPERVAFAAGRIMLARLHELANQHVSFAFEIHTRESVIFSMDSRVSRKRLPVQFGLPLASNLRSGDPTRCRTRSNGRPLCTRRCRSTTICKRASELY